MRSSLIAMVAWPSVAFSAPGPGLPTLSKAGTLYLIAIHDVTPVCEAWTVDPARHALVAGPIAYRFDTTDGATIAITGVEKRAGTAVEAVTCSYSAPAREEGDAVAFDGARWFRNRDDCTAAIDHHARVAMVWPCPPPDGTAVSRTQNRFERLLARGGTGYEPDRCDPIRFDAARASHPHRVEGTLSMAVVLDEGVHRRASYTYAMTPGDHDLTLRPRSGCDATAADLCPEILPLIYAADHVGDLGLLSGLYFDAASCRAAANHACALQSWRAAAAHPQIPGC